MIDQLIKTHWDKIELEMEKSARRISLPSIATEMITYQVRTGGKRLRPALSLMVGETFSNDIESIYPFAASVEIIHNASLVHDDVQDMDETRRGKPTIWKLFSMEQAINLGDLLFVMGLDLANSMLLSGDKKTQLIGKIIDTVKLLVAGQMLEFFNKENFLSTEKDYIEIIEKKTSSLFSLTLWGAGLIAGLNQTELLELNEVGRLFGILFQLRDDLIDIQGYKEGRSVGGDIKEGKITLMSVAFFNSAASDQQKNSVKSILLAPREKTSEQDIFYVIDLYNKFNCIRLIEKKFSFFESELLKLSIFKEHPSFYSRFKPVIDMLKSY